MKALFSFEGRCNREDWWLFTFLPSAALGVAGQVFQHFATADAAILLVIVGLALRVGVLALWLPGTVRRLHDTERSGWYSLISLVPFLGGLWMLVVCGFLRGNETTNRFGPASSD